jgi:predicted nucleotidyltransferase component of viral defense system
VLSEALAFRGGTGLYKLHLKPAARYSEDIDLLRVNAEPAGPAMDALRQVLDHWLGPPRWKQTEGRVTFVYRFNSEETPPVPLKLKVEINTREHFAVHGFVEQPFSVASRWSTAPAGSRAMN